MTYVAIVGSRKPTISYEDFSQSMSRALAWMDEVAIISGEARGIDTYARRYATEKQIHFIAFPPNMFNHSPHRGSNNRYFRRNELIATACDWLFAFPSKNEFGFPTGGTLNTINHAKRLKKTVVII